MSSVRAVAVPTRASPAATQAAVAERAATLVDAVSGLVPAADTLSLDSQVTLVPDLQYPHRPSTGLVTDPAVVMALADQLHAAGCESITILGREGSHCGLERTIELLGYGPLLERDYTECRAIDDSVPTVDHRTHSGGTDVSVAVPEPLTDGAIIPVPALRPTKTDRLAGAVELVVETVDPRLNAARDQAAAVAILDPPFALMDATTAFAGEPVCSEMLLAGDPFALDAVAADLLQVDATDAPPLSDVVVRCDGVDLDELEERLPEGTYPSADRPSVLMHLYRFYTRLAGDALPPQLDSRR